MTDVPTKKPFRIVSMEGLFGAFGLFSLLTGLRQGEIMPIFWGVTILAGLLVLVAVRRRDWQRHWQEFEKLPLDKQGDDPDFHDNSPPKGPKTGDSP